MTSEELTKLFARVAADAQFASWNKDRIHDVRFIYACEYGVIWKFTPRAWWQLVTTTLQNQGRHDFPLSKALGSRPKHISKGLDNKFHSSDSTMRCVNPLEWTIENWANELAPPATHIHEGA
jgi:hypothetical protein